MTNEKENLVKEENKYEGGKMKSYNAFERKCATCNKWGGTRDVNLDQKSVSVSCPEVGGYCFYWKNPRKIKAKEGCQNWILYHLLCTEKSSKSSSTNSSIKETLSNIEQLIYGHFD